MQLRLAIFSRFKDDEVSHFARAEFKEDSSETNPELRRHHEPLQIRLEPDRRTEGAGIDTYKSDKALDMIWKE